MAKVSTGQDLLCTMLRMSSAATSISYPSQSFLSVFTSTSESLSEIIKVMLQVNQRPSPLRMTTSTMT